MAVAVLIIDGYFVRGIIAGGSLEAAVNVLPREHLGVVLTEFRALASDVFQADPLLGGRSYPRASLVAGFVGGDVVL